MELVRVKRLVIIIAILSIHIHYAHNSLFHWDKNDNSECLVEGDIKSPCRQECREDEKHVIEDANNRQCNDPAKPKCCALKVEYNKRKKDVSIMV
ncbi:hypothetical protein AC249_AIPGENE26419 [Exaiptasia diaphana]|nr:hypothetical protein AC249_AIPGENE26419 [Exaiptasia diaphana]